MERILATGTDRVSRARAVGLVGRVLVDVKPYGGDPSVGTEYSAALEETLTIFELPAEGEEVVDEAIRVEVGEALGQAGDPRLASPDETWVSIPGGTFRMGAQNDDPKAPGYDPEADDDESPVRRVTVSPFAIGRFPVTVQEFRPFVEAGDEGYLDPRHWDPSGWAFRERERHQRPGSWAEQLRHPNRPVTEVSWYEADAYCRWARGRLPTEAEWELAARGEKGRRFPWGDQEPDSRRANFTMNVGRPTPVGIYSRGCLAGRSPRPGRQRLGVVRGPVWRLPSGGRGRPDRAIVGHVAGFAGRCVQLQPGVPARGLPHRLPSRVSFRLRRFSGVVSFVARTVILALWRAPCAGRFRVPVSHDRYAEEAMSLPLTADAPPLSADADGVVRVGGTRVTLDSVVEAFREGLTPEEIQQQYPSLDLPRVYSAITYYLHHREEVEEYLRQRAETRRKVRQEVESRFDPTGIRERLLARATSGARD